MYSILVVSFLCLVVMYVDVTFNKAKYSKKIVDILF